MIHTIRRSIALQDTNLLKEWYKSRTKKNNFLWNESTFERFYFKPQLPEPFSSPNDYKTKTHTHWKNVQKVFWKKERKKFTRICFCWEFRFLMESSIAIELWGKWQNIMFAFVWKYSLPIESFCVNCMHYFAHLMDGRWMRRKFINLLCESIFYRFAGERRSQVAIYLSRRPFFSHIINFMTKKKY